MSDWLENFALNILIIVLIFLGICLFFLVGITVIKMGIEVYETITGVKCLMGS